MRLSPGLRFAPTFLRQVRQFDPSE